MNSSLVELKLYMEKYLRVDMFTPLESIIFVELSHIQTSQGCGKEKKNIGGSQLKTFIQRVVF